MSNGERRFLVIGATGRIGRPAVEALSHAGHPVRALSRDPQAADFPATVEAVRGSPACCEALEAALYGVTRALVILAGGDSPGQAAKVARAAAGAGVERLGVVSSSAVVHPIDHPNRAKHRLVEKTFESGSVPTVFLRPGPFHSNAEWWAYSIREERRAVSLMGNLPVASIDPIDIAAAGVAVVARDGESARSQLLTGPEVLTPEQQVAILSELLGEPIEYRAAAEDEAAQAYARMTGRPETAHQDVRALLDPRCPWAETTDSVERLTGRAPRGFRKWAALNIEKFR